MTVIDEDEYADILESLVAMMDDARHAANVAIAHGGKPAAVTLEYCQRLQSAIAFAELKFPSEWKVPNDRRVN